MSDFTLDINKPLHAHFIGIGGISMSGIAEILLSHNFTISGSDLASSSITDRLRSKGVSIFLDHKEENIPANTDFVVYTAAAASDNPELLKAYRENIPVLTRAELLGQIMTFYKNVICVAGTHGKTTTTAMISDILIAAGVNPTISLGGILPEIGSNVRVGKTDFFVVESCEYKNSFLSFKPTTAVVLNISEDHLDFFKDLSDIRNSFKKFTELVPDYGQVIVNKDIFEYDFLKPETARFLTYSTSDASFPSTSVFADDITFDARGNGSYTFIFEGEAKGRVNLNLPGKHLISDSLAAAAACLSNGISPDFVISGLSAFHGTKRRFEYKGEVNDVRIIDDYAHHPEEIKATLSAAANVDRNKLWLVFQPHTYTRTKALLNEFADALSTTADHVIIAQIYPARESDIYNISSEDLALAVRQKGQDCICINGFENIKDYLLDNVSPGDLVITMGAGDVYKVGDMLTGAM